MGNQIIACRFEHQTLRCGDGAEPDQVVARDYAKVGVRQQPALKRPLTGPYDVGREIRVAKLRELLGNALDSLRPLSSQDQQLLRVAPDRLFDEAIDLVRGVQMGLMRLEGAVLAVALAAA
ncbi:unannotated protein [freshwater metagenome]|uniref:Unannotated protein n=1 Tax=freshwater metagenome TaxID=449393 RepID=A0A6J7RIT8_9ZZZZ